MKGLALFLALWAAPVGAQAWQAALTDEVFYTARAQSQDGALTLFCGGLNAGADRMAHEGPEPWQTAPYTVLLRIPAGVLGTAGEGARLAGVIVVVDGLGYALPPMSYAAASAEWLVPVGMGDPLVTALRTGAGAGLIPPGSVQRPVNLQGARAAIDAVLRACHSALARQGITPPPALAGMFPAAPVASAAPVAQGREGDIIAPTPQTDMRVAMAAKVARHCGPAGYTLDPAGVQTRDFDQDGVLDVVLDWGAVSCKPGSQWAGLHGGGVCGASHCSHDIFVSGPFAARGRVYEYLTPGILLPEDALTDIEVIVGLGTCHEMGLMPDCAVRMRWAGEDFVRVGG